MRDIQTINNNRKKHHKFQCNFDIGEAFFNVIIWILLTIVTVGIASLFFPYFMNKTILNKTIIINSNNIPIGYLNCRYSVKASLVNVLLWILLGFITLGVALLVYSYSVVKVVFNETYIEYY